MTRRSYSLPESRDSQKPQIQPVVENDLRICGIVGSKERTAWYFCTVGSSIFGTFGMAFLIPFLFLQLLKMRAYGDMNIPDSCAVVAEGEGDKWTVVCTRGERGVCTLKNTQTKQSKDLTTVCEICVVGIGNRLWKSNGTAWGLKEERQDVPLLGTKLNYITCATWVLAIAVCAQIVAYVSFGSFADYGDHRKKMLLACAVLGSLCTMLFMVAADRNADITAAILIVLANVFYGVHLVAHNSYLPVLADAHEKLCCVDVASLSKDEEGDLHIFRTKHESELSSKGNSFGYLGQLVGMIMCGAIILWGQMFLTPGERHTNFYLHFRLALLVVGAWWLLWSLPALFWLNPRPSPPLLVGRAASCAVVTFGWRDTWNSLRLAATRPNTWRMIVMFIVYCDMYGTSNFLCILIASERVCMSHMDIFVLAMITICMAVLGGYTTFLLQRTWNVSVKTILVGCLVVYACVALCGIVGITCEVFGFQTQLEMYVYAAIYGYLFAPIVSYSRVMFSDFIPIGHESSFFSIYGIMEKAPRCIGPIIIGIIVQAKADIRYTFLYLFVFAVASALLLHFCIDHEKGMLDAGRIHVSRTSSKHEAERAHVEVTSRAVDVESVEDLSAAPM